MVEIIRLDQPVSSRVMVNAGWKDVPHLDAEDMRQLEAETPEWLRDARMRGIPNIGAGAIYPISEAKIKVDPFPIPSFWPRAYAFDVGWNWTACLWMAWDRDTFTKYIYAEYLASQQLPQVHADAVKSRGAWIQGVIDPGAKGGSQRDGEKLMVEYEGLGLKLSPAINSVSAGLVKTWRDLSVGRTKVFSTLQHFFSEYRLYRRDENGKIVKKKDHLMDCMRYLHMSGDGVARVKPVERVISGIPAVPAPRGGY